MRKLSIFLLILLLIAAAGCSRHETPVRVTPEQQKKFNSPGTNITESNNHLRQAKAFYAKDKYKQAMKHCEKAIVFNHRNWEAYYYLGLSMQKRKEYSLAIEVLYNGLKHSPENGYVKSELHYSIGYSWEKMGHLEKAKKAYITALAFNPENHSAQQARNRIKIEKTLENWGKKKDLPYDG
ncbi:MAG: tetratricopeptide repeat protein [Candidatus Zixiibacteriota bacterium]|nr:MAG: tetratricopeptide repeat protein [candidate division Zixibacteria bacterium]